MRFIGTQDAAPVRLFRRDAARWRGAVHEVLEVEGSIGRLRHGLEHETLPNLQAFLTKLNRYTSLEAEMRVARNERPRRRDAWLQPPVEVFRRLIWKQGIWDGPQGWLFCGLSGLSAWVLCDKHRRLWRSRYASRLVAPPITHESALEQGTLFDDAEAADTVSTEVVGAIC
ncbi:MAG: hypothetical protein KDA63_11150 [Planctomycetales bacterium]|nr:hypothetical protein [Planctomycetales bacterium]